MDDAELVRQTLSGNHSAYGELVERYTAAVRAVCQARIARADVVEDLVQEAFLRGLRHLGSLQQPDNFGAWLRGIARNVCRGWYRSLHNRPTAFTDLDSRLDPPAPNAATPSGIAEILAEVRRLPLRLREPLLLYHSQVRRTYRQVADFLGVAVITVQRRLARARELLRRRFLDE